MTDQIFYEELRATVRDAIASYLDTYTDEELRELATESLSLLSRPTLADMTPEEREACQWMQADIIGGDEPLVITRIDRTDWSAVILDRNGRLDGVPAGAVTPRPDLPRLEWPGDGVEDTPIVEEVIPGVTVGQPITDPQVMLGISIHAPDGTVVVGHTPDCHPKATVKSGSTWQSVTGMRNYLYNALGEVGYDELESVTVVRWGKETDQ